MQRGILLVLPFLLGLGSAQDFLVGRGIADVTGAVAEGILYGYANQDQDARGLQTRQYSRTFIVADNEGSKRVAFVTVDTTLITQAVRKGVVDKLADTYGDLYTYANVMLTPTHSHSFPGGYNTYTMYQIPDDGFVNETYNALVNGIAESIERAHRDLKSGRILHESDELLDFSVNRSPSSYDLNPEEEKEKYEHTVDKEMTVLKFVDLDGDNMGMLNLFPVHTTSMKRYNHLVSGDNKGYATIKFEELMNPGILLGEDVGFVAAFAQTAEGDVSPNVNGALCEGTDEECDYYNSTCPQDREDPQLCTGRGPDGDHFEDTRIIGTGQFNKARELFDRASDRVQGPVDFIHQWVNMSAVTVDTDEGEVQLCRPSMGYSFAAGATDGPGAYTFFQGMLDGDPDLDDLVDSIFGRPADLVECQLPKPVLLPTGTIDEDWPWQPEIMPVQIFRIGDFVLIGIPAEITTMAGRRVQEAVKEALTSNGLPATVKTKIIAMANTYSSYIVTEEEYQAQRYEAASTIFGPKTLKGYIKKYTELAAAMANGDSVDPGELPPDLIGYPDNIEPTMIDILEFGESFGDILEDVVPSYQQGESASVTFISGNPRNDLMKGKNFLEIQKLEGENWRVVMNDAYWETKFIWESNCHAEDLGLFDCIDDQKSNATIIWDIPANQELGQYKMVHYGHAKYEDGAVGPYSGESSIFNVVSASGKYLGLY